VSRQGWLSAGLAAIVLLSSIGLVYLNRDLLDYRPKNEIVINDPFREPVGSGGYFSAIDYLHKNVRDSVVWIENGLPYYAFGPGITNSVTRSRPANYLVFFQTAWLGGTPGYPDSLTSADFQSRWQLVYEDKEGRVYKRLAP
jgi:hypothetical protein